MLRGWSLPLGNLQRPSSGSRVGLPLSTLQSSGVLSGSTSDTVEGTGEGVREGVEETELEMWLILEGSGEGLPSLAWGEGGRSGSSIQMTGMAWASR